MIEFKTIAVAGYAYSFINKFGKERIAMETFGISKAKAKNKLYQYNHQKLEPLKPISLYTVTVTAKELYEIE